MTTGRGAAARRVKVEVPVDVVTPVNVDPVAPRVPNAPPAPGSLLAGFPDRWTPRKVQADALVEIEKALAAGKRFIVFEGPPGVGKTLCAITLARHLGDTYVCTLSKLLQAQYLRDFSYLGAKELKGRANFKCQRARNTCELGGHLYSGHSACGHQCERGEDNPPCPYKIAKEGALAAPITVCNYYSFLYNIEGEEMARPLLVCDESHALEATLLDHVAVSIDLNTLPVAVEDPPEPPAQPAEIAAHVEWLKVLVGKLKGKGRSGDPEEDVLVERLLRRVNFFSAHREEEWIVEQKKEARGFKLLPLTVRSFGGLIFGLGQRVLCMSATILDHEAFCGSVGIPLDEAAFIRAPCVFPKENRPIMAGDLDMTFKARGWSWPQAFKTVNGICLHHARHKGLILAQSDAMIRELMKAVDEKVRRRFLVAVGENRAARYQEHLKTRAPTILVGSNLWEGIDLTGDHSRFQIIPAIPFPPWEGRIRERARLDPRWYRLQAFVKLIQGSGRSVRDEKDVAVTYVMDKRLIEERGRIGSMLPPWFVEAMQVAGGGDSDG